MRNNQIVLFENFGTNDLELDFFDSSTNSRKSFDVFLYDGPGDDDTETELLDFNIKFSVKIESSKNGISGMYVQIKEISFSIKVTTYHSESGDISTDETFEFKETDFSNQDEFVTVELKNLPFYIDSVDISMGQSLNKDNFKYSISIGKSSD